MLYNRRRLLLAPHERQAMREACRFNATLMDEVRKIVRPGVITGEIDKLVETYTRDHSHVPAQLGYHGQAGAFPASCCTSVSAWGTRSTSRAIRMGDMRIPLPSSYP